MLLKFVDMFVKLFSMIFEFDLLINYDKVIFVLSEFIFCSSFFLVLLFEWYKFIRINFIY